MERVANQSSREGTYFESVKANTELGTASFSPSIQVTWIEGEKLAFSRWAVIKVGAIGYLLPRLISESRIIAKMVCTSVNSVSTGLPCSKVHKGQTWMMAKKQKKKKQQCSCSTNQRVSPKCEYFSTDDDDDEYDDDDDDDYFQ